MLNLSEFGELSGGIEILVQMAEKGEIDPKNMDIIDVTDRFLKAIEAQPKDNLRQSGKIIFHACVLLRMKAEALLITKIEELDMGGDDFIDFDEDGSPLIYDSTTEPIARQITLDDLQRAIVRKVRGKQIRQRKVTLLQLIEALREAERIEKKRTERQPKAVIDLDGHHDIQEMDDILDLAHDEDIETVIRKVDRLMNEQFGPDDVISLGDIIQKLGGRNDWVDAFLAVLFLSNSGKLMLEQEQFYGPLHIRLCSPDEARGETHKSETALPLDINLDQAAS